MKSLIVLLVLLGVSMNAVGVEKLSVDRFLETALPAEDMQASKSFYQSLGYEVINEQPWGLVVLTKGESRLTLLSKQFFKNIAIAFTTKDLPKLIEELKQQKIAIVEDDSKSEPARIVINDPTGNEVIVYEMK